MKAEVKLLGIGHTALDHLLRVSPYPALNSKVEALSGLRQGGGPVATACVTLARLGNRVSFMTVLGDDDIAAVLLAELQAEGVETGWVIQSAELATPEATILVEQPSGKRTVILDRSDCRSLTEEDLTPLPLEEIDFLLLDGRDGEAALAAARRVRSGGGKVMCDLGSLRERSRELVAACNYCVVSRDFIIDYLPDTEAMTAALELTRQGPELAVITLGAGGAVFGCEGESGWIPPYPVTTVDTTGAGDVYHGALLHALIHAYPLPQALRFAAVVAGLKCRQPGGRSGIPDLATAMQTLEKWE